MRLFASAWAEGARRTNLIRSTRSPYDPITHVKGECEERGLSDFSLLNVHYQGRVEYPVRGIGRFVWKVELRDQRRLFRCLRDDVDVASAAGIESRHDGLQLEATILIHKLMTAQAIALVVVDPRIVRLPEIEQGARNRLAVRGVNEAGDNQPRSRHPRFE
jgi:hypothetical protein